jgi:hypothetical protein
MAGCSAPAQPPPAADRVVETSQEFDPSSTGTLTGQVVWEGELPHVPPFQAYVTARSEKPRGIKQAWANPHAPHLAPARGVGNAVILLRGVDLRKARPWDHPAALVEMRDYQITVCQDGRSPFGFVRRGQEVELVSRQDDFHTLVARGATMFSVPFADPNLLRKRRLDTCGRVELSNGSSSFWMRAHLFVADHPYLTRTDAEGRFALNQVPAGQYELVCWVPNWRVAEQELDADTWGITSINYGPPVELVQQVTLHARETKMSRFTISLGQFK